MHIPDSMLAGHVGPVTFAVGASGVTAAVLSAVKTCERPSSGWFASVSAFILAAQMFNYPVASGTSGHLLGGTLAVLLLGVPFGILSMALVLITQCFLFSDGGVSALGANIVNMALIPALLTGMLCKARSGVVRVGMVSGVSVLLAALACSAEIAFSGKSSPGQVAGAMLGAHVRPAVMEGLMTALLFQAIRLPVSGFRGVPRSAALAALTAALILLSPWMSSWPDGFEKAVAGLNLLH